jgi:hypothetical protein
MQARGMIVLWYGLAFSAAAGVLWWGLRLALQAFFAGPDYGNVWMVGYLLPLAALAVFQLIFGMATGLGRGWRFWAVGVPALYLTIVGCTLMMPTIPVIGFATMLLFGLGLAMVLRGAAARGP